MPTSKNHFCLRICGKLGVGPSPRHLLLEVAILRLLLMEVLVELQSLPQASLYGFETQTDESCCCRESSSLEE